LQTKTGISSLIKPRCLNAANPALCDAELEGGLDNLTNPVFKTTQELEVTAKTNKNGENTDAIVKLKEMKKNIMDNSTEDNKDVNPPIVDENTVYSPIIDPELVEVEKLRDN